MPGTRIMVALASLVAESATGTEAANGAGAARGAQSAEAQELSATLEPLRQGLDELGLDYEDSVILETITIWVAVIGLINGLRFGQFGPGFERLEDDLMSGVVSRLGA